jgi:hypothetical protein
VATTARRDALLAALASAGLLALLVREDALGALAAPLAVAGGVAVALLVELAFLRSKQVADYWRRPAVQIGSTVAVLAGGLLAYAVGGLLVVAALSWGLATYFALLGTVVVFGTNPLASDGE